MHRSIPFRLASVVAIAAIAAVEIALAALGYVHKLGEGARTATELLSD